MLQIFKLTTAILLVVVTAIPPLDEAITPVILPVPLVPDEPLVPFPLVPDEPLVPFPLVPEEPLVPFPLVPDEPLVPFPLVPDEPLVPDPPVPPDPFVSIKIQSSSVIEKSIVLDWKPLMVKTPFV